MNMHFSEIEKMERKLIEYQGNYTNTILHTKWLVYNTLILLPDMQCDFV